MRYPNFNIVTLTVIGVKNAIRSTTLSLYFRVPSVLGTWQLKYDALNRVCTCGGGGRRSDENTRLPPAWPGFKSQCRRHMWVEFADGSLLCSERFFSRYSAFPLSSTTNNSKFQFETERTDTFQRVLKNFLVPRLVGKQIIKKTFRDS